MKGELPWPKGSRISKFHIVSVLIDPYTYGGYLNSVTELEKPFMSEFTLTKNEEHNVTCNVSPISLKWYAQLCVGLLLADLK